MIQFKGRAEELEVLIKFCQYGKGVFFLYGAPGIGKTALLKQLVETLRAKLQNKYEKIKIVDYFIRRGTDYAKDYYFLENLCSQLDSIYNLKGVRFGRDESELWDNFQRRLEKINQMEAKSHLVFIIDGLDESPELLKYIPQNYDWLRIIISSESYKEQQNFFYFDKSKISQTLEIGPLDVKEIKELMIDYLKEYKLQLTDKEIELIADSSGGNPLYLKLFFKNYLFEPKIKENDLIPKSIEDLFNSLIKKI